MQPGGGLQIAIAMFRACNAISCPTRLLMAQPTTRLEKRSMIVGRSHASDAARSKLRNLLPQNGHAQVMVPFRPVLARFARFKLALAIAQNKCGTFRRMCQPKYLRPSQSKPFGLRFELVDMNWDEARPHSFH